MLRSDWPVWVKRQSLANVCFSSDYSFLVGLIRSQQGFRSSGFSSNSVLASLNGSDQFKEHIFEVWVPTADQSRSGIWWLETILHLDQTKNLPSRLNLAGIFGPELGLCLVPEHSRMSAWFISSKRHTQVSGRRIEERHRRLSEAPIHRLDWLN